MNNSIFWDTTPYNLLNANHFFGGIYSFQPQGRINKTKSPAEAGSKHSNGFPLLLIQRDLALNPLFCMAYLFGRVLELLTA
jgi:hypothetical protein